MQDQKPAVEDFENYRPLLFSIAYRMIGSASDAEDIVQDAYLHYQDAPSDDIRSLKSYLTTIVTHLCLDYLKSARIAREQYVGTWLPEPVLTSDNVLTPGESLEQRESISLAFLVMLETLTPPERAVFILHEIFDYPFQEIAQIIEKSPASCRQIFHRAKEHLAERRPRFDAPRETQEQLISRFIAACQAGNLSALTELLAQDAIDWSDGGGKVKAALRPIFGREKMARHWIGVARLSLALTSLTVEEVNGSLAILGWEAGKLTAVATFDSADGHIQAIRLIVNPDKLAYLQRQLAARKAPSGEP